MINDLSERIAARITAHGVLISFRMARFLDKESGMTPDRRILLRDSDPEAYENFTALHLGAIRSDRGTNPAAGQPNQSSLDAWMSTIDAAAHFGVTDRCIRKWCRTGQLPATWSGNRWWIDRNALAIHDLTA